MNREFGKYELLEKIGAGGMAEVFLAKSVGAEGLEKILVIKRVLPEYTENRRFVDMFISEASIAVGLNHPNVVQIYDFGKAEEQYFLAMEYVDGCDLAQLLTASRRGKKELSIGNAIYIASEVAKGLFYAHRREDQFGTPLDIVHRDISPQNILVSRDGGVKIVDFGIAKATSVADESPHIVKGKFSYMSPEQASGRRVDSRSDLFSLGVVLFELACDRPLFKHTTQEETLSLVKSAVVPDIASLNDEIPESLAELLYRLLSKDPDERHADGRELAGDLTKIFLELGEISDNLSLSRHLSSIDDYLGDAHQTSTIAGSHTHTTANTGAIRTSALRTVANTPQQTTSPAATRVVEAGGEPGVPDIQTRERKEVVIVAGDLVGLFELRATLGQDRWLQVLQEYTRIVDAIAFKNDAVVHRVNEDGFVMLFGIPVSSENDAELALRVTLDLHEAVAGMSASFDATIQLSAGVAVGNAILEQELDSTGRRFNWSFHGHAHELAERLARSAMAREILLGGQVYRRIKRVFHCDKVERIAVPDAEEEGADLQAWRLTGPKSVKERISEVRRGYHNFYGRELELKAMRSGYRDALLEPHAAGVVIMGAQGIGKSALVEEFMRGLDPRNVRIVRGIARPYDRDVPLGSMATLIANVLRLGEQEDLRQVRDTLAMRITALFPDETREERDLLMQSIGAVFSIRFPQSRFDELTGDERRDRTFLSLTKLVTRFAEKKPMVLAIDDAHYIDSLTLEFAKEFLGALRPAPAFLIMTAEAAGPHIDTPEWSKLLDATHVEVLRLDDLGEREAESLVRELLRLHRIDDEGLVADILHQSGGNPLYVREVIEVLRDRGMLKDSGERRSLSVDQASHNYLPSSVEGLIGARIDRLPLAQKSVLQKVSFLWTPFSGADIALVLPDSPLEELEALVDEGLLERADVAQGAQHDTFDPYQRPPEERKYQFCNALTQEVAARGLVPEEARETHRLLADYLMEHEGEHRTMTSALIAHHFDGAGEQERSVKFYSDAADRALEQYGASEAQRLAEKVLQRVDDDSEYRYRALKLKAKALQEMGQRDGARDALTLLEEMARAQEDPRELVDVILQQAHFWFEQSELRKAKEYIKEAREIAEREGAEQKLGDTWLQDAIVRLTEGRREEANELTERAIEVFSKEGASPESFVRAKNLRGVILRQTGLHDRALVDYEEALETATKHELRKWRRYLLTNTGLALAYLGKFQQALARYEEALEEARELGHRKEEANLLINIGHAHVLRGDLDEAFSCLRRGNYLARKVNAQQILADGLISLGACYVEREDFKKAEDTLQEGLRIADSIPNVYLSIHATLLMAKVNLTTGSADGARVALMQAEDALERAERAEMVWAEAFGSMLMARAYRILGKRDRALEFSERAMRSVDNGELYAIEEILYHHAELLPDDEEHETERKQALRRAREVVMHRRDLIADEAARKLYMSKPLNRQIVTASGLLLDSN